MKGILGLIAIIVAGYALRTGFGHFMNSVGNDKGSTCVELLGNTTTEEENGPTYITGSVRNNCDYRISQITIAFKTDRTAENQSEDMAFAYSSDVKPGEIREYQNNLSYFKRLQLPL